MDIDLDANLNSILGGGGDVENFVPASPTLDNSFDQLLTRKTSTPPSFEAYDSFEKEHKESDNSHEGANVANEDQQLEEDAQSNGDQSYHGEPEESEETDQRTVLEVLLGLAASNLEDPIEEDIESPEHTSGPKPVLTLLPTSPMQLAQLDSPTSPVSPFPVKPGPLVFRSNSNEPPRNISPGPTPLAEEVISPPIAAENSVQVHVDDEPQPEIPSVLDDQPSVLDQQDFLERESREMETGGGVAEDSVVPPPDDAGARLQTTHSPSLLSVQDSAKLSSSRESLHSKHADSEPSGHHDPEPAPHLPGSLAVQDSAKLSSSRESVHSQSHLENPTAKLARMHSAHSPNHLTVQDSAKLSSSLESVHSRNGDSHALPIQTAPRTPTTPTKLASSPSLLRIRVAEASQEHRTNTEPHAEPWSPAFDPTGTAADIAVTVQALDSKQLITAATTLSTGSTRRRDWSINGDGDRKQAHRRSHSLRDVLDMYDTNPPPPQASPNTQRATQFATLRFSSFSSRQRPQLFTPNGSAATLPPAGPVPPTPVAAATTVSKAGSYASLAPSVAQSTPQSPAQTPVIPRSTTMSAAPPSATQRRSWTNVFRRGKEKLVSPPSPGRQRAANKKEKHVCSELMEGISRCECGRTW